MGDAENPTTRGTVVLTPVPSTDIWRYIIQKWVQVDNLKPNPSVNEGIAVIL